MYKEIAEDIQNAPKNDTDKFFTCVTRYGTKLKCENNIWAIKAMQARYAKATNGMLNTQGFKAAKAAIAASKIKSSGSFDSTMNSFIDSNETANALEYARLKGKKVYFGRLNGDVGALIKDAKVYKDARFVTGKIEGRHIMIHIASGMRAGKTASTRKAAIENFERALAKTGAEKFDEILAKQQTDFQEKTLTKMVGELS